MPSDSSVSMRSAPPESEGIDISVDASGESSGEFDPLLFEDDEDDDIDLF
jgi:hypothetical protein